MWKSFAGRKERNGLEKLKQGGDKSAFHRSKFSKMRKEGKQNEKREKMDSRTNGGYAAFGMQCRHDPGGCAGDGKQHGESTRTASGMEGKAAGGQREMGRPQR